MLPSFGVSLKWYPPWSIMHARQWPLLLPGCASYPLMASFPATASPMLLYPAWASLFIEGTFACPPSASFLHPSHHPSPALFAFSCSRTWACRTNGLLQLKAIRRQANLLLKLMHPSTAWANSGFISTSKSWLFSSLSFLRVIALSIIAWIPSASSE